MLCSFVEMAWGRCVKLEMIVGRRFVCHSCCNINCDCVRVDVVVLL